jgi:O-antigen/teichoic acid export membrane protein
MLAAVLGRFGRFVRFAFGDAGSVKTRVVRSGIWLSVSGGIDVLLNVIRSIVLARLLTPEMFGLMGLASIAIRTIETFTRPGISQALIARQGRFEEASATAFTLLIGRGLVLAAVLVLSAGTIANFYEAAELEYVLIAMSSTFIVGSLANINIIARQREIDFKSLTHLNVVSSLLSSIVTITAAFWLRNVWALVIGQLAAVSISTALSYYFVPGRMRLAFDWPVAHELMTYGKFITGSSIFMFIAAELDSLVLGKLVSLEVLGLYALAYSIANLATANLSKIVSTIMMPAYSKLQSDLGAVRNAYLRSLNLVMLVVLPISVGMMLVAEPLILNVYGEQWTPAARGLQILAVFGLVRSLASFTGYLFEGIGAPQVAFQIGFVRLLSVALLVVPLVLWLGLEGAALTATAGVIIQWLAGLYFLGKRLALTFPAIWTALSRPLWTSLVMASAVLAIRRLIDLESLVGLALVVLAGAAVYVALNFRVLQALRRERLH